MSHLQLTEFHCTTSRLSLLSCQVLSPCASEDAFLRAPPLEKQFLISPPCSPPVGWEQPREGRPVVDYDLIAAMAQLAPGEPHELHPTKQINVLGKSVSTPSIVVHIAAEEEDEVAEVAAARRFELPTININAPMGAGGNFTIGDDEEFDDDLRGAVGGGGGGGGPGGGSGGIAGRTRRIRPTRCPDRQSSLD